MINAYASSTKKLTLMILLQLRNFVTHYWYKVDFIQAQFSLFYILVNLTVVQ
jgi:hypothetical protein